MRALTIILAGMVATGCIGTAPTQDPGAGAPGGGYDPGTTGGGNGNNGNGTGTGTGGGDGTGTGGGTGGGSDGGTSGGNADLGDPLNVEPDPLVGASLKTGATQLAALCARNNGDAVSKAFCASPTPPAINSLVDLQKLLGLDFKPGNIGNGTGGNPAFAMTGHSSSLVTKFTSAINPRAIIFTPPNSRGRVNTPKPLASFIAMGFVRGEQFVELVSNDPVTADLNFFLFKFQQACNARVGGCMQGDLLTPAVESNFASYSLYQDTDIKNTVFDCLQCHQTGGPTTKKNLRMQELQNPWGHFFRNNRSNGQAMLADYTAAHGQTETYAGIPGAVIFNPNNTNNNGNQTAGGGPDPAALEGLVENQGFKTQPNEFNTGQILDKGESATWLALYANSMKGLDIPPPFHENRVTDPTKLLNLTKAYSAVAAGTMPIALMPDIRDIFLDSALPDLSFRPATALVTAGNGLGILTQICQQCHNPTLDQTLTRAKFDVTKLATMDRAEKDKAILRLNLGVDAFRRMPPPRFRELSPAEIQIVTQELMK